MPFKFKPDWPQMAGPQRTFGEILPHAVTIGRCPLVCLGLQACPSGHQPSWVSCVLTTTGPYFERCT